MLFVRSDPQLNDSITLQCSGRTPIMVYSRGIFWQGIADFLEA